MHPPGASAPSSASRRERTLRQGPCDTPAVWVDEKGVGHTVALPDPTRVMTTDFQESLDALIARDRDAVRTVVEQAESLAYETGWSDLVGSKTHVEAPAPADLLQGHLATPEDVGVAVDEVVPRWRLDVIMALDDYVD